MRAKGIGVQVNYIPAYWHPIFQGKDYPQGMCPIAENYYSRQLSLPMHFNLTEENVTFVSNVISELVEK